MKKAARLVLFGALVCGSAASQQPQVPAGPPNIQIISGHWFLRVIKATPPIAVPNNQSVPHEDEPIPPIDPTPKITGRNPPQRIYVYSAEVLNTGPKDIKRLSWTYSLVDAENHGRRRVLQGHSIDRIRVNQKKTLEITSLSSPSKVINVTAPNSGIPEEWVAIACLLFVDGSSWENPMAMGMTCEMLRNWKPRRRH